MTFASRRKSSLYLSARLLLFLGGCLFGFLTCRMSQSSSESLSWPAVSTIAHIDDIPSRSTSHVDQGSPITKQQLVEPFVISSLAGFSVATLRPGQVIHEHAHESMVELFYVLSGQGKISINQHESTIKKGNFIQVAPRDRHSLWVDADESESMVFIVCGLAPGPKTR